MSRFIIVAFLFMAWAYYELSGGADFRPETVPETVADAGPVDSVTNDEVEAALVAAGPNDAVVVNDAVADALGQDTAAQDTTQLALADPDPATSVVEPADEADVTFVSLSRSQDGTALTAGEPTSTADMVAETAELRSVEATRLNVRAGPSTGDGVVGQLTRGEEVTLVSSNGDGWSLIRLEGDGLEGWVANRFLVEN